MEGGAELTRKKLRRKTDVKQGRKKKKGGGERGNLDEGKGDRNRTSKR